MTFTKGVRIKVAARGGAQHQERRHHQQTWHVVKSAMKEKLKVDELHWLSDALLCSQVTSVQCRSVGNRSQHQASPVKKSNLTDQRTPVSVLQLSILATTKASQHPCFAVG